tara:strand:- start:1463 stop:1693 length:231 start_codon:yes stop_codon:yes gene_type:complete
MSLTTSEAFKILKTKNNRYLCNFIKQRADMFDNPTELYQLIIDEVIRRKAEDFKNIWSGKALKDEPIEQVMEELGL